jgi:hypothetical protein
METIPGLTAEPSSSLSTSEVNVSVVAGDLNSTPDALPILIKRAAAALDSATTAAEILDARDQAIYVYSAANTVANLAKRQKAHDEIVTACRRAAGDALNIQIRALARLTEEYDTAQTRGEVQKHGGQLPRERDVRDADIPPTMADIGLDRKRISEARKLRDAEKVDPGIIDRTIDDQVRRGKTPSLKQVLNTAKEAVDKPKDRAGSPSSGTARAASRKIAPVNSEWDEFQKLCARRGVTTKVMLKQLSSDPETPIDPGTLPQSAQAKLEAAIRTHKRWLDTEFEPRVQAAVTERTQEWLDHQRKLEKQYREVIQVRPGVVSLAEYQLILRCLHPDRSASETMLNRAFDFWVGKKLKFVSEAESRADLSPPMPATVADLLKAKEAKRAADAARRKQRAGSSSNIVQRRR